MYWKKQPIQEYFDEAIEQRRLSDISVPYGGEYCDEEFTTFILLRNFDESVEFLTHATKMEMVVAIDTLSDVVEKLPKDKAQVFVDIFKKKLEEFPDISEYSVCVYEEELESAQYIVDHME